MNQCRMAMVSGHLLVVHGADPALHVWDVPGGGHLEMAVMMTTVGAVMTTVGEVTLMMR